MKALVIGGTGMLAGLSSALIADGYEVYLPSRRPVSLGTWIEADWTDPAAFVSAVRERVTGPDLLVLWCHRPYRAEVARLLASDVGPEAVVVEVVGSGHYREAPDPRHFPGSRLVVLGRIGSRWLTDSEISDGVLAACRSGEPERVVGTV